MSTSLVNHIYHMFVTRNNGTHVLKDVMCELHTGREVINWCGKGLLSKK